MIRCGAKIRFGPACAACPVFAAKIRFGALFSSLCGCLVFFAFTPDSFLLVLYLDSLIFTPDLLAAVVWVAVENRNSRTCRRQRRRVCSTGPNRTWSRRISAG